MTDAELERLVADGVTIADRTVALLRVLRAVCDLAGLDFAALVRKSKAKA